MRSKSAFTLIETVIVVAVIGMVMSAVTGILINSFRAKNKIETSDKTEQIGGQLLNELKGNILSAIGTGMTCTSDVYASAESLSYVSANDGGVTTLTCVEGAGIASASASGTFDLTGSEIKVGGCHDFARCVLYPGSTDRAGSVNFSFTLSTGVTGTNGGGADSAAGRQFQSTVVVRN